MGTFGIGLAERAGNAIIDNTIGMALQPLKNKMQLNQQKKLQKLQIKGDKELAEFQRQQQMKMWQDTNYPAQVEQLKKAGLNIGLQYGMGGGGGTTTGAGTATTVQGATAEMPQAMGIQMLTSAQMNLMRAQADNLDADTAKKSGVDTEKTKTEILDLTQGIQNKKANEYLTNAQTESTKLANWITDQSKENRLQEIENSAKLGLINIRKAGVEADIAEATEQAQIKILNEQAITAGLNNIAIRYGIELTKQQIENLKQTIQQGWKSLQQGDTKNAIEQTKAKFITEHPTLMQTAGKEVNDFLNNIWNVFGKKR